METIVVYAARALIAFLAIVFATSFVLILGLECTRGRKKAKPMAKIKFDYRPSRFNVTDSRDTMASWRKSWRV